MSHYQRYICPVCRAGGGHPKDEPAPFCHECTERVVMKKAFNDTIIEEMHDVL
jgi:DNA-directed RNA polymerase subunit RPC12/RpoP